MSALTTTLRATRLVPAVAITAVAAAVVTLGAGSAAASTIDAPLTHTAATSSGSTGMVLHITNNSNETMRLTAQSNPYGHWQKRPVDIAAHTSLNVSDESNSVEGSEINLAYQMPDGTQIQVQGSVPLGSSNSATATSSTNHFTASAAYASGYHPTFNVAVADV